MMFEGILPGSDPATPNTFVPTPEMLARRQAIADALMKSGSDYSPVRSPWQGFARLAQALDGAIGSYQVDQAQRLGMADQAADQSNVINRNGLFNDPGEAVIPATPGQTTPALAANDAANDAVADAQDSGANPRAALLAALGGGSSSAPSTANPALVAALSGAPQGASSPLTIAAALGAGTPYGTNNVGGGAAATSAAPLAKAFAERGYSPTAAAGIVGNLTQESGLNPRSIGDNGTSFGLANWHNERATQLRSFAARSGLDVNDPQTQIAFLDQDLRTNFPRVYSAMQAAKSPHEAADIFRQGYEIPAADPRGEANRRNYAGSVYSSAFAGAAPQSPASQAINAAMPAPVAADATQGNRYLDATARANDMGRDISEAEAVRIATGQPAATYSPSPATVAAPASSSAPAPSAADIGALRSAMTAGPPPVPSVNATMSGHPADAPAKAISPSDPPFSTLAGHGDVAGLLRLAGNPWSSPAAQQVAQTLLQNQMPQRPSIIEGPTDPNTGYATKLVWSPTQGVLGRLNADGSISPAGAGAGSPGGAAGASGGSAAAMPAPPPGVDPKIWRETLARRNAELAVPSTDEVKGITTSARADPAYQEADVATSTYNSMLKEAQYNNHASDKALIDAFAKINNPGRAVGVGQYTINADLQSLPDTIKGEVLKAYNGDQVLSNKTRAAIIQLARQRVDAYQDSWNKAREPFISTAKRGNVPDWAVPDIVKPEEPDWTEIGRYKVLADGVHDSKNGNALVDPRTLKPTATAPALATAATPTPAPAAIAAKMQADPQGALAQAKTLLASRPDLRPQIIQRLQAAGIPTGGL